MKLTAVLGLLGSLAAGGILIGAASPAFANEALPADLSQRLDEQPVQFTASAAKRERMMIIQQNMARQRAHGQGGYRGGYGYGPRPGYGPRHGYGPRSGYGYPRGYYGPRY